MSTSTKNTTTKPTPPTPAPAPAPTTKDGAEIPSDRELINEGSISMLYPKGRTVFYNPVQVQNRDLSILMIDLYARRSIQRFRDKAMEKIRRRKMAELAKETKESGTSTETSTKEEEEGAELAKKNSAVARIEEEMKTLDSETDWKELHGGIRILDALAASGLRSLRYWKEIDGVRSVTINDLDQAAVDLARENIKFNGLEDDVVLDSPNTSTSTTSNGATKDDDMGIPGPSTTANKYTDPALQRLHHQNLNLPPHGLTLHTGDATHLMYTSRRPPTLHPTTTTLPHLLPLSPQYDVIDLDPYGSASPFLDGALQAVRSGGLLAITCTDMAALGGSHPETCYGRYGGAMPIPRVRYLQELAVRILVGDLARRAAVYGRVVRPVVCVGMAFYVRVFVEVWDDKAGVNKLSLNIGTVYQSVQCPSFHIVPHGQHPLNGNTNVIQNTRAPLIPVCNETGGPFKTAGPLWIGPLHDLDVVKTAIDELEPSARSKKTKTATNGSASTTATGNSAATEAGPAETVAAPPPPSGTTGTETRTPVLATHKNLHGLLTILSEELPDAPLYYTLPDLCHTLGCSMPPMDKIRCALVNAGYRVSVYHKERDAIKTDAPNEVLWDVLRVWCKEHPPKKGKGSRGGGKEKRTKKMRREEKRKEDGGDGAGGERVAPPPTESTDTDTDTAPKMTASDKILAVEPKTEVSFAMPAGGLKDKGGKRNRTNRVVRFPMNPEANWGPKPRASGYSKTDRHEENTKTTKKRKVDSVVDGVKEGGDEM